MSESDNQAGKMTSLRQIGAAATTPARVREGHAGAILAVDLGAIRENYRRLRARFAGKECAAVVKADAYGLGADHVAPALAAEGCRYFFVAHLDEGIALRGALGADAAIHVLNGLPLGTEADCLAAGLTPVLNSAEQVEAWRLTAAAQGQRLPAVIQIDTGMARLGMEPREFEAIADDPQALDGIEPTMVMSHLACADDPAHEANERQRVLFGRLSARLPVAARSLANSSGIFLDAAYHHDLARPGVALYGVNPTPGAPNPMRRVVSLSAKVVQVRDLPTGAGVGYGQTFHAPKAMRAATVAIGYADGWRRNAMAAGYFEGVRLPIIGRVSMDSIIVDISALPQAALKPGDLVEMIGDHQSVDDIARAAETIGYEVLTSLGSRFHRRYAM